MNNKKQCDVCGNDVLIDKWGNGKCKICGWHQSPDCLEYPNAINPPNFASFNEAKKLYKDGLSFSLSFDRLAELVDRGFDISFIYNKKRFLVDKHEEITLWQINSNNYSTYKNIISFMQDAKIDNLQLRDIWQSVKAVRYEN